MQNGKTDKNIKTINKAMSVLRALSSGHTRLSDIAREVKISKNGVFRLLYSLKQEGMVVQDPGNREYFMGPMLFELSANPLQIHQHLINCANLDMEDLRQATGETIVLHIKFGVDKIILRQLIGIHSVTFVGKPNPVDQLWVGAPGKVLLAQLSSRELEVILNHVTLAAHTSFSVVDKQVFQQEIEKTQKQGYATSYSEVDLGLADIAVPVRDYIVPASLAIIGPESRLAPRAMDYVDKLKTKAQKISQALSASINQ